MIKIDPATIGIKPLVIEGVVEKLTAATDAVTSHVNGIGTVTHNLGTKSLLDTKDLFVEKEGETLPTCAVTHRNVPGEFRGYLQQQTTLSQAAESCKSRRKVQRIDGA